MTTQQIEMLLAIEKEGTLRKAAETLFISQPALTQSIQKLERNIGMPLFDRTTIPMKFSEAGKLFVENAKVMKQNQLTLEQKISDLSQLKAGRLTIGVTSLYLAQMLSIRLKKFAHTYPGIKLNIIVEQLYVLKEMISCKTVDLVIGPNAFCSDEYTSFDLFSEKMILALPNVFYTQLNIAVNKEMSVSICQCKEVPFIFMKKGTSLYCTYHNICEEANYTPNIYIELNQIELALNYVDNSIAAALIPENLIMQYKSLLRHTHFVELSENSASQQIVCVISNKCYHSQALLACIKLLCQEAAI